MSVESPVEELALQTSFARRFIIALTQPLPLTAACSAALLYTLAWLLGLGARSNQWDFSHYYVSALALRHGLNPYTSNLGDLGRQLGLSLGEIDRGTYPPTFLLCFEPLTLLTPAASYWVWITLTVVMLAASMAMLLGRESGLNVRQVVLLVAATLLYTPLEFHFYYAQSQILMLFLVVLMMRWLGGGRDRSAGLILALAALLRVFPVLLGGYLIVMRRWRALGWMAAGLAAGAAMTLAVVGLPETLGFLTQLGFLSSQHWLARPANVALGAFVSRLFWYTAGLSLSPGVDTARRVATVVTELAVLALTVTASWNRDERDWRSLSLWVVAMILLSPTAWIHYLVLLLIPFCELAAAANRGRASSRAIVLAVGSYGIVSLTGPAVGLMLGRSQFAAHLAAELIFLSLALAYLSAYYFLIDEPAP